MPPRNPESREHMWRVTSSTQISANALKSRLELLTRRTDLTRDMVLSVALVAAENAPDGDLIDYVTAQNGVQS